MEHSKNNVFAKSLGGFYMQVGLCAIILSLAAIGKGLLNLLWKIKRKIEQYEIDLKNLKRHHAILEHWLNTKIKGQNLEPYFEKNEFRTIAVYGLGTLGCCLCRELQGSSVVKVEYGIDKNIETSKWIVRLKKLSEEIVPVDAVIVTAIASFHDIKRELEKYYQCPILSLEEVVYSL